jgi:hypothetical protein
MGSSQSLQKRKSGGRRQVSLMSNGCGRGLPVFTGDYSGILYPFHRLSIVYSGLLCFAQVSINIL